MRNPKETWRTKASYSKETLELAETHIETLHFLDGPSHAKPETPEQIENSNRLTEGLKTLMGQRYFVSNPYFITCCAADLLATGNITEEYFRSVIEQRIKMINPDPAECKNLRPLKQRKLVPYSDRAAWLYLYLQFEEGREESFAFSERKGHFTPETDEEKIRSSMLTQSTERMIKHDFSEKLEKRLSAVYPDLLKGIKPSLAFLAQAITNMIVFGDITEEQFWRLTEKRRQKMLGEEYVSLKVPEEERIRGLGEVYSSGGLFLFKLEMLKQ